MLYSINELILLGNLILILGLFAPFFLHSRGGMSARCCNCGDYDDFIENGLCSRCVIFGVEPFLPEDGDSREVGCLRDDPDPGEESG